MRTLLSVLTALLLSSASAQTFCDPAGNMVLYSNYDGGILQIDVDEDIPDLLIGVVSYEFTRINVSGPFAANVVQVVYAGYDGDNDHCGIGGTLTSSISSPPGTVQTITQFPASTYPNPNGYGSIICAYSCDITTDQGGCNTADQVAHYFLTTYGGVLRSHRTQYGCWQGVQTISAGGNCCANPISTAVAELPGEGDGPGVLLTGGVVQFRSPGHLQVLDLQGRVLAELPFTGSSTRNWDPSGHGPGIYLVRDLTSGRTTRFLLPG